jgi:O-antigen ligase
MKPERTTGWFHWILPMMIALSALDVLLSQRNLSLVYAELAGITEYARHPAMPWIQRGVSVVLILIAAQRISAHFAARRPMPSVPLAWAFIAFWVATVASPALLGAHRDISHEYLYTLIIGFAGLLVTTQEVGSIVDRARDSLFVLMLASVVLVPVWPTLVLDESYTQGLLPGVPRLGGLAPHPVAMGMFAQTALLLLWARPYKSRWLNAFAWVLGLGVLFFAQSKTSWIAFILCAVVMAAVRNGPNVWRRLSDPREGAFGIALCVFVMMIGAGLLALFLFADFSGGVSDFLNTEQGEQLMTLTGRDQIWAIAWEQWDAHKVFGYGPGLFDDDFRMAIHMANATNAHNQFMDSLARSGLVGAAGLIGYAIVLLVVSLKYARRTGGLSAALFIALALRSISEVPLLMFGYGNEFFAQLLLLVTLAAAASLRVQATQPRPRAMYGAPA